MKSPQDMRIIQIDVTNACIHQCSNCTRFCGHHKKPFFMDVETFKKAVDSMEGYVGTVSMMGGEPTIHPQFEELLTYLGSKYPNKKKDTQLKFPQRSFLDAIHEVEMDNIFLHPCTTGGTRQTIDGPGLWSAMGDRYKKYFELIQDTIDYQALNDHSMPMYHQPALISRKSLGIPDDEWLQLRDNCWVQNEWSACITPKGAFFCEVAGALDMLFDGPGGWPVEPGWWKRTPEEFGDQLKWCEICGLALETFTRDANEEVDDVSPDIYEKLKEVGSRKVGTKHIHVVDIKDGKIDEGSKASGRWFEGSMPYTESYAAKFDAATQSLSYKKIEQLNLDESDDCSLGELIADKLMNANHHTYLLILAGKVEVKGALERMEQLVLNPGTLMYRHEVAPCEDEYFRFDGEGYAILLSGIASSIKQTGWDAVREVTSPQEIKELWNQEKIVRFAPESEYETIGSEIIPGKRYVIYGAGETAPVVIRHVLGVGAECIRLIDGNHEKWGTKLMDIEVSSPDYLETNRDDFDYILIASTRYYSEIRDSLYERGFGKEEICWWL